MDYTFDLARIFFGEHPPLFYLEVILRTTLMFGYLLIGLRITGQRGVGQLSLFELVVVIAMGSAVGDPMFYQDVPLLHGMAAITVILLLQRFLINLTNRNRKAEVLIEGMPYRLVADGVYDTQGIEKSHLSRDEVMMELRVHGVSHLGQVKRAYLEIDGEVSLFYFDKKDMLPGLPVLPDVEYDTPPLEANTAVPEDGHYACFNCGHVENLLAHHRLPVCPRCEKGEWRLALNKVRVDASVLNKEE